MRLFPAEITDIHTHSLYSPESSIYNLRAASSVVIPAEARWLSIGLHPWDTCGADTDSALQIVEDIAAADRRVLAIGECGFDKLRGADYATQERLFRCQVEISERLGKPLIIHCVRAFNELLALKSEICPQQMWIIHGFRGKEQLARQLVRHGIALSLGRVFNPAVVGAIPSEMLFRETDAQEDL